MRPNYRYKRRRYSPEARAAQSAIWLIGLGVLFLTGWWWPGILILVGLSMVVSALVRESAPAETERLPEAPAAPPPPATPPTPFVSPAPDPVVLRAEPPADKPLRLPDICPYCGAPPRTLPARDPANPYACPYCGANLQGLSE
jgi:hypothetical protein